MNKGNTDNSENETWFTVSGFVSNLSRSLYLLTQDNISEAIRKGNIALVVKHITARNGINETDCTHYAPIHTSVIYSRYGYLALLLEAGININIQVQKTDYTTGLQTALHIAIYTNKDCAIKLLLFNHADYQTIKDARGRAAFEASLHSDGNVQQIMSEYTAAVTHINSSEKQANVCIQSNNYERAAMLYQEASNLILQKFLNPGDDVLVQMHYLKRILSYFAQIAQFYTSLSSECKAKLATQIDATNSFLIKLNHKELCIKLCEPIAPPQPLASTHSGLTHRTYTVGK